MNASQVKTALDKAIKPVPFLVFTEKKFAKPELEIGNSAKAKLQELARTKAADIEGRGVCRKENDNAVIFSAKVAKPAAKSIINVLCHGAKFMDVRFKEGKDAEADLTVDGAPTDDADTSPNGNPSANGSPAPGTRPMPQTRFAPNMPSVETKSPPPPAPTQPTANAQGWTAARPTTPSDTVLPKSDSAIGMGGQRHPTPPNASAVARTVQPRNLPPVATLPSTAEADVAARFSDAKLAEIRKKIGGGGKMGNFEEIFNDIKAAAQDAPILAMLSKPRNANSGVDEKINQGQLTEMRGEQLKKYNQALAKLKSYDPNEDEAVESEEAWDAREDFRRDAEATITKAIDEIKYAQRGGVINLLATKNVKGGLTDKEEGIYHEKRAEMLILSTPQELDKKTEDGSGFTRLLKDDEGKVAYAFKTIAGESEQIRDQGVAEGAVTAQEILTSKLSNVLGSLCGFQSGFPKATLATLPVSNQGGNGNVGALIEGLDGAPLQAVENGKINEAWKGYGDAKPMSEEEKTQALARCKTKYEETKDEAYNPGGGVASYVNLLWAEFADKAKNVPTKSLQGILLMGLASVNADTKWSSIMADGQDVRPFDGGGAMLSTKDLLFQARGGSKDGPINPQFGMKLVRMPHVDLPDKVREDQPHRIADEPLDSSLVKSFAALDLEEVRRQMMAAVTSLQGSSPIFQSAIDASNVENSIKSMQFMKEAMQGDPTPTTEQFLVAYNLKMKAWLEQVAATQPNNG